MAKRIVVLEYATVGDVVQIACVLWAQVPASRQPFYANASAHSLFKDASQAEVDALKAGQIVERRATFSFPIGTTAEAMEAQAVAEWTQFQAEITNANQWSLYGSHYDDDDTWYFTGVS